MNITKLAPQHENLLDIDDVEIFSPKRDQPIFDEIKAVLERHNAQSRFGVCLLHRHFDVNEGEMLLEECDAENRTLTIQPVNMRQRSDLTYIETNWRFDLEGASQGCTSICATNPRGHTGNSIHLPT